MYKLLRNTHLLTGLFASLFLLMYGVSAVQMAHNKWFDNKPAVIDSQAALAAGMTDDRAGARELMDHHGIKGDLAQERNNSFRIARPRTAYEVTHSLETATEKIRTN